MIELNGNSLTIEKVWKISQGEKISICPESMKKVKASREIVEKIIKEERVVYGITTGFGHLCNTRIDKSDLQRLQVNLISSHAITLPSRAVEPDCCKNILCCTAGGVRPELIER